MKTILINIIALILVAILFSFAPGNIDESSYDNLFIKYSVERTGSSATLQIDITNIGQYDEVFLKRSLAPLDDFRQIKRLSKAQMQTLIQEGTIIDKYPLPGNKDAYYKVVVISSGTEKSFPSVKLSRYHRWF